jgi:8-oxo-dGTP pyrophosphatase MutT (NUDIX family)
MEYTTSKFGDILPKWQQIPLDKLIEQLKSFVIEHVPNNPKKAFIIEIPIEQSAAIPMIKSAGFELYYATNEKFVWMIKNDAMIPPIYHGYAGVQVFVVRKGFGEHSDAFEILMVEEKYKVGWGSIAGPADNNEFPRDAACRELFEEVGLTTDFNNLKLICSRIRRKANAVGAINYDYYYICDKYTGEITINPDEIVRYKWISVNELATETTIDGLNVSPILKYVATNMLYSEENNFKVMLDCRQWNKEIKDQSDVLHLEYVDTTYHYNS